MIVRVSLARMLLIILLLLTPIVRGEAADQKASARQEAPTLATLEAMQEVWVRRHFLTATWQVYTLE